MSGTKSKNKGKTYERELANFLTELYKEKFTRVPYSGAFVGGSNIIRINDLTEAQTRSFKGDLIPPETFPKIVFEAKHYANFQWNALALGKSVAQVDEWIQQSEESCEAKDKWLLCVKISRQGSFVLWDHTQWMDLNFSHTYRDKYQYLEFADFWNTNSRQIKEQSV